MKKVDFMIVGAMKSGTSSLADILRSHKDICFSHPKEPRFFVNKEWKKALEAYHGLFSISDKLWGEGSTGYTLRDIETTKRIAKDIYSYNPKMKFIYILRDPITRIESHYLHFYGRSVEALPFDMAIRKSNRYIQTSSYYSQIQSYIDLFGRDQVLICFFEDLKNDTLRLAMLNDIATFLNISPNRFELYNSVNNVSSKVRRNSIKIDKLLNNKFLQTVKGVVPLHFRTNLAKWLYKLTKKKPIARPKASESDIRYLMEYIRIEVEAIEKLTNRDLTQWKH